MTNLTGCQLPCLPRMAEGQMPPDRQPLIRRFKRSLAVPWNYHAKPQLKHLYRLASRFAKRENAAPVPTPVELKAGDTVRVRTWPEIAATLDPFKELKGCAFLPEMEQYCGTAQRVFQVMERFLDERDYKVKKVRGVILLEGVICRGTPAFGRCDRCCLFFWRQEWLEKVD